MPETQKTPRPGRSARERILDAYEESITTHGASATTLEAVARLAEVSKGGLIYHFPSKDALADAEIERFAALARESADALVGDAPATIRRFVIMSSSVGDPLDRAYLAVTNLARNGHEGAAQAALVLERDWYDALLEATGSVLVAQMAKLIGDGLYHATSFAANSRSTAPEAERLLPTETERERIIDTLLRQLDAERPTTLARPGPPFP